MCGCVPELVEHGDVGVHVVDVVGVGRVLGVRPLEKNKCFKSNKHSILVWKQ